MKNYYLSNYGFTLIIMMLFITQNAYADIYKCISDQGTVYYNDKACPVDNEEIKLNAVKDPVSVYIPPEFVKQKEESRDEGIVVGRESESQQASFERKDGEKQVMPSGGGNSDGNKENNIEAQSEGVGTVDGGGGSGRTAPKTMNDKLLPRIPLKIEEGGKESRGKRI